eukprot:3597997-Pyramimonas_sp.AAC.1
MRERLPLIGALLVVVVEQEVGHRPVAQDSSHLAPDLLELAPVLADHASPEWYVVYGQPVQVGDDGSSVLGGAAPSVAADVIGELV